MATITEINVNLKHHVRSKNQIQNERKNAPGQTAAIVGCGHILCALFEVQKCYFGKQSY